MSISASLRSLLVTLVIALLGAHAFPAAAQQAPLRIRATIEKIDGNSIVFNGKAEGVSSVALDSETVIYTSQPSSLNNISAGDYVASTAVKQPDGTLHSKELRIFPDALHGIGEGQRPMKDPNTIMTNATVAQVVGVPEGGRILKVKYKNKMTELIVDPQVPVSAVVWSDVSALKPGMRVYVLAVKAPDGTVKARRILSVD